jgi:hypothetical protein
MNPSSILTHQAVHDDYLCDLCGGPGALPTTEHNDDPPGFTLYGQPVLCDACSERWSNSTREFRRKVRQWLGSEPTEGDAA